MTAPDCFHLEPLPGRVCTHWKTPPCAAHANADTLSAVIIANGSKSYQWFADEAAVRVKRGKINRNNYRKECGN
jgi:hypothetical protein